LAARATYSATMLEPAPSISSTTICWPRGSDAITEGPRRYVGSRFWREADNEADKTRRVGLLGTRCWTQKWQRDSIDCQLKKLASPVVHNHSSISVAIVNRRLWQEIVPIAATRIT